MRVVSTTDTWDGVWAAYDQDIMAEAPPAVVVRAPRHNRRLRWALPLTPLLALLPTETLSLPGPAPWQAGLAGPVISLAPDEASLPPLAVAIARIAAESADGACFAMRLHPQGNDCRIPPAR